MIGALLMLLCLAIIFLTRPNKHRDRFIEKFTSSIKLHFFNEQKPNNGEVQTLSLLNHRIEEHVSSPVQFTDNKVQQEILHADQTLLAYLDGIEITKDKFSGELASNEKVTLTDNEGDENQIQESIFHTSNLEKALDPNKKEKIDGIVNIIASLKLSQQPPKRTTDSLQVTTDIPRFESIKVKEIADLNELKDKIEEIEYPNKDSFFEHTTKENEMDNSIIDIDSKPEPIDYSDTQITDSSVVPDWPHMYVYGYSDLEKASSVQRTFYDKFKVKFLTNIWVDTLGNSNYIFILLFDLLKQFNVHKNINVLEEHMNQISAYYPKTRPYAKRFLIEKMREIGNKEGLDRLEWTTVNNNVTEYQPWEWKNRSIRKLKLSKQDAILLDNVYINQNNFFRIEFCSLEIVKLYITAKKTLHSNYTAHNLTQEGQFAFVLDLLARKQYKYHLNSQNYKFVLNSYSQEINAYLFKYCENKVRELYDYPTLNFSKNYHEDIIIAFTTHVISFIEKEIIDNLSKIEKPNLETEQQLNSQVTTRWKKKLPLTLEYYQHVGKDFFLAQIERTLLHNSKNPSLEIIYYEVSKFLVPFDKQLALESFLRYTNQHFIGSTLTLKIMPQMMVKKLFSTPELQTRYHKIALAQLKKEITLDQALEKTKNFFLPQRKKIVLDTELIKQVEQQHSGTVDVLNEYLKDEDSEPAPHHTTAAIEEKQLFSPSELQTRDQTSEEIKDFLPSKRKKIVLNTEVIKQVEQRHSGTVDVLNEYLKDEDSEPTSIHTTPKIGEKDHLTVIDVEPQPYLFNASQYEIALLKLFKENNFNLTIDQMDAFCKSIGTIKRTMINNLNENCYDILDDLLVETEEAIYALNQTYYKQILKV